MESTQEPILPVTPTPAPSVVQSPPPPENKPDVNRLRLIILGVIVVLLAIGIPMGVMLLGKKAPEPVAKVVSTPTPTPDPTANWKTYSNNIYSFKYPSDWTLFDNSIGQSISQSLYDKPNVKEEGSGAYLGVSLGPKLPNTPDITEPVGTRKEVADKVFSMKVADITLDSTKAAEYQTEVLTGSQTDAVPEIKVYTYVNNQLLTIAVNGTSETDKKVFEQFLSTFKFLDQSADDTANWKTYKNTKYNYSVNFPPDWTVKEEQDGNKILIADPRGGYRSDGYSNVELWGDFAGDWLCTPGDGVSTKSSVSVKEGVAGTLTECKYSGEVYPAGYKEYLLDAPNNTFVYKNSGFPSNWAFGYSQPEDTNVKKILSSFRLTK